jgi:glycosyltransferase involved in cell wall biosynthesis
VTSREPLRVLICIDSLGVGGKERQAVELIRGLAARGGGPQIDFRVVCFDSDDFYLRDLTSVGIKVIFMPRRVRWDVSVIRKLQRLVDLYQPDAIHTNGLVSSFYALPAARLRRIPLINGSIRNAFARGGFRWRLERFLLELSEFRVANSYAGLRSRNLSEQCAKNLVIYNGFDFGRLDRSGVGPIRRPPAGEETKRVGMVAEFNRFKDYFTFIEAARILGRKRRDVQFVAVGDGEMLSACRTAADGLGAVTFVGSRHDVEEVVATLDIGVLCSFVEGLPNCVMEYMSLAKPVVATAAGGTQELVVHGETGFLVRPADPAALATAIEHLIDHPDVAEHMGNAGRVRLRREFSITRMIDETVALYGRAAASSRTRGSADPRESWTVL